MATKHQVVVWTKEYLDSIGKNNSVGKYDKIVHGVKEILGYGYLDGDDLRKAIKREADRLLKKYNLDAAPKKVYDPVLCMMVDADKVSTRDSITGHFTNVQGQSFKKEFANQKELADFIESARKVGTKFIASHGNEYKKFFDSTSTRDRYFDVSYSVGNGIFSGVMVQANSEQEAIEKAKKHSPHIARAEKVVASPSSMSVESARMRGKSVIDREIVEERKNGVELIRSTEGYWIVKVDGQYIADGNESRMRQIYKEEVRNNDSARSLDKAIKMMD